MLNDTRQWRIYELLRNRGSVRVTELQQELSASDMTIRRDLKKMAEAGLLKRVHGGAVSVDCRAVERSFGRRQVEELTRKLAIAKLARGLIQCGQTIFLDASTTCHELAKQLTNDAGVRIVTNSLSVLLELSNRDALETTSLGGTLEQDGNTLDGPVALDNAERLGVDVCFFSACGFTPNGITNPGPIGTSVKRAVIRNAGKSVLLAAATKFGRRGFIEFCTWSEVDVLVSDSLSDKHVKPISDLGVEVLIAEVASEGGQP